MRFGWVILCDDRFVVVRETKACILNPIGAVIGADQVLNVEFMELNNPMHLVVLAEVLQCVACRPGGVEAHQQGTLHQAGVLALQITAIDLLVVVTATYKHHRLSVIALAVWMHYSSDPVHAVVRRCFERDTAHLDVVGRVLYGSICLNLYLCLVLPLLQGLALALEALQGSLMLQFTFSK